MNIFRPLVPAQGSIAATTASTRSRGVLFVLVTMGLIAAIVCFGFASVPTTYLPRRGAGDFVIRHRVDVTVIGIGLVVAAALAVLWSNQF